MSLSKKLLAGVGGDAGVAPAAHAARDPRCSILKSKGTWNAAQPLLGGAIYTPPVVEGGWSAFAADRRPHVLDGLRPRPERPADRQRRHAPHVPRAGVHADDLQGRVNDDGSTTVLQRIPLHLKAGAVNPARAYMAAHPTRRLTGGPRTRSPACRRSRPSTQGVAAGLPADAAPTAGARRATRSRTPPTASRCSAPTRTASTPSRSRSTRATAASGSATSTARRWCTSPPTARVLNRIVPAGVTVPAARRHRQVPAADTAVATQGLLPRAFAPPPEPRDGGRHAHARTARRCSACCSPRWTRRPGQGDQRTLRLVRFDVSDALNPKLTGEFVYRLDTPAPGSGPRAGRHLQLRHLRDRRRPPAGRRARQHHLRARQGPEAGPRHRPDQRDRHLGRRGGQRREPDRRVANAAGITPVAKTLWLDLNQFGYDHDKPEGIGLFPNGDLAVQDDNDFGFNQGNDPQNAGAGEAALQGHRRAARRPSCGASSATNIAPAASAARVPATLVAHAGRRRLVRRRSRRASRRTTRASTPRT